MNATLRMTVASVGTLVVVAAGTAAAHADTGTFTTTSGSEQRVIVEPVCNGEYVPVTYDDDWRIHSVAVGSGGVHLDLIQHGTVAWTQDDVNYVGTFSQSQSQDFAAQDVLRDDLTVEVAGSDGSHVHAWVRIIGQIRDGQPHLDQWSVGISC